MLKLFVLFLVGMVTQVQYVHSTAESMAYVAAHFGRSLDDCREESGLTRDIMEEFHHFWNEDFEVVHRELGCAIKCVARKYGLIYSNANLHHENMDEYVRMFPEGEKLAALMVQLIHQCELLYQDEEDDCMKVTKTAACFKVDAKKHGVAPDIAMIESVIENYEPDK